MTNISKKILRTGFLILLGLLVILYLGMGILYFQQGGKQAEYEKQSASLQIIISRPAADTQKLLAEYKIVNEALAPVQVPLVFSLQDTVADNIYLSIIDKLYQTAIESRIDVTPGLDKFSIPSPGAATRERIGTIQYQIIPFKGIKVQGSYDSVMEYIRRLDSGSIVSTLVLKQVIIENIAYSPDNEVAVRVREYFAVKAAIAEMMSKNNLEVIPNPVALYANEIAVNDMARFPDIISQWNGPPSGKVIDADGRGYSDGDQPGYTLFQHDAQADAGALNLVNYIDIPFTIYYYTCEADGTLRQFDGPNPGTDREFTDFELNETQAILNVDLYSLVPPGAAR